MNRELKIKNMRDGLEKLSNKIKNTTEKEVYISLVKKFLDIEKDIEIQQSYMNKENLED